MIFVYGLWDCAFEVGHATASVSAVRDMIQNDFTILTNYLEAEADCRGLRVFRRVEEVLSQVVWKPEQTEVS